MGTGEPRRFGLEAVMAITAVAAAFGAGAAPAAAESGRHADVTVHFTTDRPGAPSGLKVALAFRDPDDPEAKPPPLDSAVLELPAGVRFDEAAAPVCTASDEEVEVLGAEACPDDTRLTLGSFSAMFGFGPPVDPVAGDLHVFHGPSQLLEIITVPGGSASPAFDRITIEGTTLRAHPPKAPGGPPDGRASVRTLAYEMPVVASGGHTFVTTPPSCPESGAWTTTGTFGFSDGSTETASSVTPCSRPAAAAQPAAARPALRLAVHPPLARAGHRTRVRLRATSNDAACVTGARVRVAGRTLRTDGEGRVVFRATFRGAGARRAVVSHDGCAPAITSFRVAR